MDTALAILAVVVLGLLVTGVSHRSGLPAPSLLVLVGLGVGLLPITPDVVVSPDLVLKVVLPPLLFAGARGLPARELRDVAGPLVALAFGLVAVTAVAVAFVVHGLQPDVSVAVGFVLGAILASTDPVAVSALARRLDLPRRLEVVVQGESLLNDATSLVLFTVATDIAVQGGSVDVGHAVWTFVRIGGGGALVGLVLAQLRGPGSALVAPYAAFLIADALDVSGVTAVVVCGIGFAGRRRQTLVRPYKVLVVVLEGAIFAAIGLELPGLVRHLPSREHDVALAVVVLLATVLAVRALALMPAALTPRVSSWRPAAVASWAGTRGVVPLAAALSLPQDVPHRPLLLVLTSGVVIASLVVQGLTLAPLTQRLLPPE